MTPQKAITYFKNCNITMKYGTENYFKAEDATNLAIEALERQIPEKPNDYYGFYHCPACEHSLVEYKWSGGIHYCHYCGQAIDWSEE